MRIIGGKHKGKRLKSFSHKEIRPSSDRLREALFAILDHRFGSFYVNCRGVDFFAGAGSLGIEALSRGAKFWLFLDSSPNACRLIAQNLKLIKFNSEMWRILRLDVIKLGRCKFPQPFSLGFIDPPYNLGLADKTLRVAARGGWFSPGSLVIVEEDVKAKICLPEYYTPLLSKRVGKSQLLFLRFNGYGQS